VITSLEGAAQSGFDRLHVVDRDIGEGDDALGRDAPVERRARGDEGHGAARPRALRRARPDQPADRAHGRGDQADDVERTGDQPGRVVDRPGQQGRLRPADRGVERSHLADLLLGAAARLQVQQRAEHVGGAHPGDGAVVDLDDDRSPSAVQSLDDQDYPQRATAVQLAGGERGDHLGQLGRPTRRAAGRRREVCVDVDVRHVDPHRDLQPQHGLLQAAAERRQQVQALAQQVGHVRR
jgi:hypothetical protein